MQIQFENAKTGKKICSINGIALHSKYDPEKEAERYVQAEAEKCTFSPALVIVIEPALSYCAHFLQAAFPDAKLACIRACADFAQTDYLWHITLNAKNKTAQAFGEELFLAFGEELLCAAFFTTWTASAQVFKTETDCAWQAIKQALLKSRDILGTREYFAKRWLKNMFRFCACATNIVLPPQLPPKSMQKNTAFSGNILIAASGPSLEPCLPFLRSHREDFFLIALSSALNVLQNAHIHADLFFSTDGGYWAKEHLAHAAADTPLACSAESAVPFLCYDEQPIMLLNYGGIIEEKFFALCDIGRSQKAKRNGTVSGTAACFALDAFPASNIFFCGLDLASGAHFQHANPNALFEKKAALTKRITPLASILADSRFTDTLSLQLYRNWFSSQNTAFTKRIFRIFPDFSISHNKNNFSPKLGNITDISFSDYEKKYRRTSARTSLKKSNEKIIFEPAHLPEKSQRIERLLQFTHEARKGELSAMLKKEIFPALWLTQKRKIAHHENSAGSAALEAQYATTMEELEKMLKNLRRPPSTENKGAI
ncbi:MAG: DUF115 domain-containing protein [Treponemataceae bacterium]|nr:MAG: DUF115 domain-containing protein [Treponemataceae bacterium]